MRFNVSKMSTKKKDPSEYRVFTVKHYNNSDEQPLRITLKGKTKEFKDAHATIKSLIKRGSEYFVSKNKMKIVDVAITPAMCTAIVQVNLNSDDEGNAELKLYKPSVHKRKGATIELRKMNDSDYTHILVLKEMIVSLLDDLISGEDIEKILKKSFNENGKSLKRSNTVNKLIVCDICNWQTKRESALKSHKARIHEIQKPPSFECDKCKFKTSDEQILKVHIDSTHKGNKRMKPTNSQDSLNSPVSPPRKKDCLSVSVDDSVEMMDIEIEAHDVVVKILEDKVKDLENVNMQMEKEILEIFQALKGKINILESKNAALENEVSSLKSTSKVLSQKPPKHLKNVHGIHLDQLRGYQWRYIAKGNGACANNCIAVALHEDEDEAPKVKRRTLDHMIEFEDFYINKIGLPFKETVGVGEYKKEVHLKTKEEMIKFLKSEDAMMVWSNAHELVAMANLYNITIEVFSYGGSKDAWTEICPDPDIVA